MPATSTSDRATHPTTAPLGGAAARAVPMPRLVPVTGDPWATTCAPAYRAAQIHSGAVVPTAQRRGHARCAPVVIRDGIRDRCWAGVGCW
jgi:hypothetical protein